MSTPITAPPAHVGAATNAGRFSKFESCRGDRALSIDQRYAEIIANAEETCGGSNSGMLLGAVAQRFAILTHELCPHEPISVLEALVRAGNAQAIAALAANMDAGKCAICGRPLCGAGLGPWIDDEEYGDVHESCLEAKQ